MTQDPYKEAFEEFDKEFGGRIYMMQHGKSPIEEHLATTKLKQHFVSETKHYIRTHFVSKTFIREELRKVVENWDEALKNGLPHQTEQYANNIFHHLSQALLQSDVSG